MSTHHVGNAITKVSRKMSDAMWRRIRREVVGGFRGGRRLHRSRALGFDLASLFLLGFFRFAGLFLLSFFRLADLFFLSFFGLAGLFLLSFFGLADLFFLSFFRLAGLFLLSFFRLAGLFFLSFFRLASLFLPGLLGPFGFFSLSGIFGATCLFNELDFYFASLNSSSTSRFGFTTNLFSLTTDPFSLLAGFLSLKTS